MNADPPVEAGSRVEVCPFLDGQGRVIEFGAPPGNILDAALIAELDGCLETLSGEDGLKLIVLKGAGKHFSYGASVEEHLPGRVEAMLPAFHALLRRMNELPLPPLAACLEGRCLGGGFELALACDLVQVASDARLGLPEIHLGVFPPAGAVLLGLRAGPGRAMEMVLSGRTLEGKEAVAAGIAEWEAPAGEGLATLETWARTHLLPHSAAALRQARRAARRPWREALETPLAEVETQYLGELMATEDAREGLQAFLEKRKPAWRNR